MTDPLFSVAGQIVLVSGGSRGIGFAIAQGFAERGAHVVVTGRSQASLEDAARSIQNSLPANGGSIHPIVCDVASAEDQERLMQRIVSQWGRIDTLVNVAGVNRRKPALEVSEDDFDFVLDINLRGAFFLAQRVGRQMVRQQSGSQIHIASLNSDRPLKHVLPYAVSKAGIAHMTRALALEWGDQGVRVNAIAPGFVLTDLTRKLWSDPTMQQWGRRNTPQRRLGEPGDMVGTSIFLASPAASFVTGQVIYVDGGFTAGWNWPIPDGGGQ